MTVVEARTPARAPGLELLGELSASGYEQTPCSVRRADGQTIQVTPLLYQLLEAVDGERDLGQLAEELGQRCGKTVTPDDVRFLLDEKLVPLGLLCDADGAAPAVRKPTPLLALRCKFVISDPAVTRRITSPFAVLFRSVVVVPVLVAFAATCWWVLFHHGLASGTRQAFDTPGLLLGVFALVVVSAGWHEFGHAAACRASGATPGAMGAGLYLVWPAFYTDVDDSYRLSRWGRLKVDLGGLYFNTVAAVAVMGVWLAVRMDALLLVVATQLLLMVRQLAPVIRADGYHILADLVGVPDLFQHIKPTLTGLLPTNWGKPQPLRRSARWIVRTWVLLVVPLLLWMFVMAVLLLPRLAATAWQGLQVQGRAMSSSGADGDLFGILAAALKMLSLVLPVAAGSYMVVRVVRKTAGSVWARTEGRPAMRFGTALVSFVLILLLALAWWPSGQYKPVAADERGAITDAFQMSSARQSSLSPVARPAFRPIAGVEPRTGYALVPRDERDPALLLVRNEDGVLRSIVTDGGRSGVAFPFELPEEPGDGDNQALAVNTGDGTVVYDVAVALVWVKDGEVADNRNEAYALASCTACTTVAVAFQVVLVIGQSDVVTPINVAVAANGGCVSCQTTALAVQLIVTLREMPTDEVKAQIEAAMARLDNLAELDDPYAEVKAVEQEILTILVENGLVDEPDDAESTTASTSVTTSTTLDPDATTTTTRSTTTTADDSTTTTTRSSTTTTTESSTTTTADDSTTTTDGASAG